MRGRRVLRVGELADGTEVIVRREGSMRELVLVHGQDELVQSRSDGSGFGDVHLGASHSDVGAAVFSNGSKQWQRKTRRGPPFRLCGAHLFSYKIAQGRIAQSPRFELRLFFRWINWTGAVVHTGAERDSGRSQHAAGHNVKAKFGPLVLQNKWHNALELRRTLLIQCDDSAVRAHDAQITFS